MPSHGPLTGVQQGRAISPTGSMTSNSWSCKILQSNMSVQVFGREALDRKLVMTMRWEVCRTGSMLAILHSRPLSSVLELATCVSIACQTLVAGFESSELTT